MWRSEFKRASGGIVFYITKPNPNHKVSPEGNLTTQTRLCYLQVAVSGATDSNDVVVISIDQPANAVEEQISGVER